MGEVGLLDGRGTFGVEVSRGWTDHGESFAFAMPLD